MFGDWKYGLEGSVYDMAADPTASALFHGHVLQVQAVQRVNSRITKELACEAVSMPNYDVFYRDVAARGPASFKVEPEPIGWSDAVLQRQRRYVADVDVAHVAAAPVVRFQTEYIDRRTVCV